MFYFFYDFSISVIGELPCSPSRFFVSFISGFSVYTFVAIKTLTMAKRIDTVTITIDAQAAREEMAKLKKRSDELGKSIAEMKKQLDDPGLSKTSAEWKQLNKEYKDAKKEQKELNDLIDQGVRAIEGMDDVLANLSNARYNDVIKQQKTLLRSIKNAVEGTEDYAKLQEALHAVTTRIEELKNSWKALPEAQRQAVVADPFKHTVEQIKEAIKATEKLRDSKTEYGSAAYDTYDKEIGKLQEVLDLNKKLAEEQAAREAEARRVDTIANKDTASVEQLKEAIKLTQELRDAQAPSSAKYGQYDEEVEQLQEVLNFNKKLAEEKERQAKLDAREATLRDKDNASVEQLKEAIKLTQELRDAKSPNSAAYSYYQKEIDELQEVLDLNKKLAEEQERQDKLKEREDTYANRQTASVEKLKEALKLTEQLRDAEERGSGSEYSRYKQEAEDLQKALEVTKEMSAAEAMLAEQRRVAAINDPTNATVEQLEEAIKATEKLRDANAEVGSDHYKLMTAQITKMKDALKQANEESFDFEEVLKDINHASIEDLERAAKALEAKLRRMAPDTKAFIDEAQRLREVNARIDDLNDSLDEHDGVIKSVSKRLAAYVAVYGGFNFILGKLKEIAQANLELSDSLSDIQKTTGLAGESLRMLSRDIDAIDTRTSQEQLHQLAATAGQMGISVRTEVLGFVKASNQLNVALNELGEDGVLSLSKIAQLTGDVGRMGIEKSLLSIGSSINELSANSAASAGPIADFMRRVGGLAPVAKLATSDLAALGATADALGQPIEVAGTAMNKFIMSLVTNTEDIAYALNLDVKEMKRLIDTGQTMEAIVVVLEKLKSAGSEGGAALSGIFKELGGEGARITQVLSAMSQNTEFLRDQVELSAKSFREATSATNEYNVKNESAAAIWERIGNTFREAFVNADYENAITSALKVLLKFTKALTDGSNAGLVMRNVLLALAVQVMAVGTGLNKMVKSLFVTKQGTTSLTQAWHKLNAAMRANAFGLILGAALAVYNIIKKWNQEQKALTAHVHELTTALNKEKDALKGVNDELKRVEGVEDAKEQLEARNSLIKRINSEYGMYLEYQLNEAAGYKEIAAALELVNQQLDLKYAKQIYEKRMEKATESYESATDKPGENLVNKLSKTAIGDEVYSAYGKMLGIIKELARESEDTKTSLKLLGPEMQAIAKAFPQLQMSDLSDIHQQILKIYNAEVEYNQAAKRALSEENANVIRETEEVAAAQAAFVDANKANMEKLIAMPVTSMDEKQLHDHYKQILDYGEVLLADAQKKYDKRKAELDAKKEAIDSGDVSLMAKFGFSTEDNPIEAFDYQASLDAAHREFFDPIKAQLDPIIKAYEGDAWGKALNIQGMQEALGTMKNLGTASVDDLVKTYKTLESVGQKYTTADLFNAHFGTAFKTRDEMLKAMKDNAEQVKNQLKELGYTTSGNFDWSTEKGRSNAEKEYKKQLEAAKSALKAYYEEQETIIKQAYLDREITHEEMTRRISKNEQEQSEAFVDLYNVLLGEAKKYGTNLDEILKGKNLQKLGGFLRALGPAMVDGMKKGRAESEGAIRDEAIAMRQIIEKAMLEGDVFGKLERDFRETLDELSLLARNFGSSFDAIDANMADGLVKELMALSDQAYTVNEEGLKKLALQNTEYADWWNQVEDEQLTLLLQKLQGFYDDRLDVQRKYIQKAQREWQQQYKQSGGEAQDTADTKAMEERYETGKQAAEKKYTEGKQMVGQEEFRQSAMSSLGSVKSGADYRSERATIQANAGLEVEKIESDTQLELEKISKTAEIETRKIDSNIASLEEKLKARALAINAELAKIIEMERMVLAGMDPNADPEAYAAQAAVVSGLESTAVKQAVDSGDAESVALSGEIDTKVSDRKAIEAQATLDANAVIAQSELDTNAIIVQSAQETTQSVLEQWQKRAESLSGWAEMVGETMGEVWMLEKQANDARARGDEETAKELENQAKESRQNLVKEALNKAIDMAKVWAMELGFKVMYNALAKKSDEDVAASGAKATLKGALADIIANGFKGAGKEVGSKGMAGLITGAVIIAAAAGLAALAKSAVNNMFPEATEGVSDAEASTPKRKLTTGMLTYAEGKYPVLGDDGVVYDAEYAGANMRTGVYRKPHFGIFAEKQPEMVIDGKTTQRLVLNYPEVYNGILQLSRTGRMGMRTYADGNVVEFAAASEQQALQQQQQAMQMEAMNQTLAATAAAVAALTRRLDQPINATVNRYGKGGSLETETKAKRWEQRMRVR